MSGVIVTLQHLRTVPDFGRKPGYCARGARAAFARHGLDWMEFLRNGMPAETLEATGDALALALVRHAQRTEAQHGR